MAGIAEKPLTWNLKPDCEALDISEYEGHGGYEGLRKALRMAPTEMQKEVKEANLRGRGGAGFNTGLKWSFVPMGKEAPRPKYLIANADEMEPGTFKDRLLLERNPHLIIEGMTIASFAIEAETAFVFLRWEYTLAAKRVRKAIAEAYERGYLGRNILGSGFNLDMRVHVSAGRYICGEETALLNALEGRRAIPRSKPPFPQTSGLWGRPTVVNNVETLSNVPHIILRGAAWYKNLSRSEDGGTKLYGVSGRVNRPGLWELPMGTTAREILEEHAGGMADGFRFRCLIPGGASTEFICEESLDVKMDFDSVQKAGSRLGTGTMIVLDHSVCPVAALHNLQSFFAQESCGWCTPCREGLPWVVRLLGSIEDGKGEPGDIETLREHTGSLWMGRTYCALAPGAMEPLKSGLSIFREDFERHLREKGCPWKKDRSRKYA